MLLLPTLPIWSQIDRGTIRGTVTDASGAVVPGAKVQIIRIDTNSTLDTETNAEGLFIVPNLPAGNYRLVVEKTGFSKVTKEPVEVQPRVEVTVTFALQPGAVNESVTVSGEAPILDTEAVNNAVGFKDNLVQELPLIVVGTKRDVTGFLDNIPGANQTNTFILTLNGSQTMATEAFVDGVRASERIERGSLAENGPFLEQVQEVSVVSSAFNAEYGGFGSWFTNVVIKSGTNQLHGSVFDHLGNDKLNARSFFAQARTPYRQNEGGFTLGGPVVIPHVYNGRNKTFFFASLGLFYSRQGAAGFLATVPTQAMLSGNFSGLTTATGATIPIYDPATQVPDGNGSYVRSQFPGNIIPSNRITQMARIVASYIPAPSLPGELNNFYDHRANTWPYYNTTVPLIKIDHSISDKQKVMFSYTHQTRPRLLWGNPAPGLGPQPVWGQPQTNPLDQIYDQQDTSWKIRFSHDYIISPTLVNHFTTGWDREFNIGPNGTDGQGWDQKLGITGIPADNGAFPALTFSGGTAAPAAMGRGYDVHFYALDYTFIENLTWVKGKHTFKFGVEFDRDRIDQLANNNIQGSFAFSNLMTSQPDSPAFGSQGSSVASFLLGAVGTAGAFIPQETGLRDLRIGAFAQDEWRATPKLTISYGLRWDYNPSFSEVHNLMSSFEPNIANPGAGGRPGALAFAGQAGLPGPFFATNWKPGLGPRLGVSYQLDSKTVIRSSGGIYYQSAPEQLITTPASYSGYSANISFNSPDGYTPLYYINSGTFPQTFQRPPALDPSFLNGQAITWLPPNGTRLPQTLNYTFSIQREISRDLSIEATYLGNKSTHLAFTANYNYLPLADVKYGSLLLQPITSASAAAAGFGAPYPAFVNQPGANTVYQSLRPYPQYTAVTTSPGEPSGQQKFNSLQIKATKRAAGGLTLFGYMNWAKSFTLTTGQYPGWRFWQQDPNAAFTFSFSWSYYLPFGQGKSLLHDSPRVLKAIVSNWKINGEVKYASGVPLTIGAAAGNLGSLGYTQWGNAVVGANPYLVTNPRDFNPATSKFLNAAAFTTSTGFNFGNLNPNLSWVRGFWYKEENLTVGRIFPIKERVRLDFSLDAANPFNFVRWGNPNTTLTSAAFGTVNSVSPGRTIQANAKVSF